MAGAWPNPGRPTKSSPTLSMNAPANSSAGRRRVDQRTNPARRRRNQSQETKVELRGAPLTCLPDTHEPPLTRPPGTLSPSEGEQGHGEGGSLAGSGVQCTRKIRSALSSFHFMRMEKSHVHFSRTALIEYQAPA